MSYDTQAKLAQDGQFQNRVKSCCTQQANSKTDELAGAILRGDPGPLSTFYNLVAASPGFGDSVDMGDGSIDQSKISDNQILASVQSNWSQVATLYFPPPV